MHFCHGAPGLLLLLCQAHQLWGGEEGGEAYLPAAHQLADLIWERGLLRKVGTRVRVCLAFQRVWGLDMET